MMIINRDAVVKKITRIFENTPQEHDKIIESLYNEKTPYFHCIHHKLNSLFKFMNDKAGRNGHFNAEESRCLIAIIENIKEINNLAKNIGWKIVIEPYYEKQLKYVEKFLCNSNGSAIPDGFKEIKIANISPVFSWIKIAEKSAEPPEINNNEKISKSLSDIEKALDSCDFNALNSAAGLLVESTIADAYEKIFNVDIGEKEREHKFNKLLKKLKFHPINSFDDAIRESVKSDRQIIMLFRNKMSDSHYSILESNELIAYLIANKSKTFCKVISDAVDCFEG